MQALIDGDGLVYACGFAAQHNTYFVEDKTFELKKDANWYADSIGFPRAEIDKVIEPEPVENALHSVKLQINMCLGDNNCSSARVFLSGEAPLYRDGVATAKPYKGNRDKAHKPIHYQAIRDYMVEYQGAEIVDWYEADDALGMHQTDKTVLCTSDKDLNMIPGWHYNIKKAERFFVTPEEGLRFFYKQCLIGDATDNIPGCYGIGPKKADKIIDSCETEKEMYQACLHLFHDTYPNEGTARFLETARLVWIWRKQNDEWNPPC